VLLVPNGENELASKGGPLGVSAAWDIFAKVEMGFVASPGAGTSFLLVNHPPDRYGHQLLNHTPRSCADKLPMFLSILVTIFNWRGFLVLVVFVVSFYI
jgi:hypothetical protein